jgi:hypothetical protein
MLKYRRRSALRLFARAFALVAGLAIALGALLSAAQAAPVGMLKQFRVPTADSEPRYITVGSDGNLWFTEAPSSSGRTPIPRRGDFPQPDRNDHARGPDHGVSRGGLPVLPERHRAGAG